MCKAIKLAISPERSHEGLEQGELPLR